jgi:enamine deaminase RidA (YjgF/YER057c/UK114 family)
MGLRTINPPTLSTPSGYSHAVIVEAGPQIHVSGQVALDAAGQLVGRGDLTAQTEQVYRNLTAALAGAGATLADVLKAVIYVVGLTAEKAAAVRAVRQEHFGDGPYPASTMVGVTALVHPELLVEIEVVARAPGHATQP